MNKTKGYTQWAFTDNFTLSQGRIRASAIILWIATIFMIGHDIFRELKRGHSYSLLVDKALDSFQELVRNAALIGKR
jgi:hypothetical protein